MLSDANKVAFPINFSFGKGQQNGHFSKAWLKCYELLSSIFKKVGVGGLCDYTVVLECRLSLRESGAFQTLTCCDFKNRASAFAWISHHTSSEHWSLMLQWSLPSQKLKKLLKYEKQKWQVNIYVDILQRGIWTFVQDCGSCVTYNVLRLGVVGDCMGLRRVVQPSLLTQLLDVSLSFIS